ncbi:hypothetical protein N0V83_003156 [Neocucurbitaria cava]|uniref:Chitin deacetylase n=1 Tax=Neocucurbitaria cava TaxID=798079 RepID=A0A9W8YE16_9PLEO|nr:hypothetical protein N0V83_003156 [Neocucurbitaria cava]
MRISDVIAASLVAPLVAAHGGIEGAPKVFGLPKQLRARNPFAAYEAPHNAQPSKSLHARQSTDGRCGPEGSNQLKGYCGTTQEHCQAPDCLIDFGPACDANKTPAGETTRNDPRPQLGSIPYGGEGIYVCNKPGTVALTYDDGPYIYTDGMLDLFAARGAKATFFITGNNNGKGAIDENWSAVIKRMVAEGHQVASHTWSHQDLSLITSEQVYDQMVKNEMAIRNILGKYPTYMRPPYSSCTGTCQSILSELGYVVTYFDLDTDDYDQQTPEHIQIAKDNFKNGIDTRNIDPYDGDRLSIAHDIHELTANNLTAYMLDYLYSQGLTAVTLGECLNDPEANWYRDSTPAPPSTSSTRTSTAPTATPTGPTSADGSCGASGSGQSCVGFVGLSGLLEECCSEYGWCGNSETYCQTGCQQGFGKCGTQPSASPSASATSTGPVPTPTGPTSTDGMCGSTGNGQSCIGFIGADGLVNSCCSSAGWCGNSDAHCQTGCQPGFGNCGSAGQVSSSSSIVVSTSSSSSAAASSSVVATSSVVSSSIQVSSSVASSSVYVSSSVASSSVPTSSSVVVSSSSYASSTVVASSSVYSSSATASHVSSAAPSSTSVQSSASPSGSASESAKHDSTSVYAASSTSTGAYSASTPVSVSKDSYPSGSSIAHPSGSSTGYAASSPSPIKPSVSSSSIKYPASSPSPVKPTSTPCKSSTLSTIVKPSSTSTPCKTTSTATPTPIPTAKVSKDGKCGAANGGQTCAGYKNVFGEKVECCCSQSGKCSTDPWACGVGCDKGFGKCNTY